MAYPNDFQKRTLWSATTGLAIVVLGAILVGSVWLSGKLLGYLQPVLVPLVVAGIIAYLLDPVVAWLQKHQKLSRLKAVLTVFAAVTVILSILGTLIIPKVVSQTGDLIRDRNQLGSSFTEKLENLQDSIPGARPLVDWITEYRDPKTGEQIVKPYPFRDYTAEKRAQKERQTTAPPSSESVEEADEAEEAEASALPLAKKDSKKYITAKGDPIAYEELTVEERAAIIRYQKETKQLTFSDQKIGILLAENWQTLTKTALTWLQATTKVFGLLGYLLGFLLVPVYLYYFLNESSKIKATWHQYIPLKASKFKDEVVSALSEINSYLISFFRGQVLVSLIDGILVGIALSIFQLPYGFLIGLALAVIGILPFIGNIICMVPAAFIAFIHFGSQDANHHWLGDSPWAYVGAVIAIFLVVQQINSLVTAPKIVGESVGLHPMTVIFSILFWSLILGGFLGALLAVPLTAAVKVIFNRYIWQRRISPQLQEAPAEPLAG